MIRPRRVEHVSEFDQEYIVKKALQSNSSIFADHIQDCHE